MTQEQNAAPLPQAAPPTPLLDAALEDETKPVADGMGALAEWFRLRDHIAAVAAPLVEKERKARKRLFSHFFPSPTEGTNTFDLPDGFELKGTYPIDRTVDAEVVAVLRNLRICDLEPGMIRDLHLEGQDPAAPVLDVMHLSVDPLLKWEPKLVVKPYKQLTAEQRKLFDRCLSSKPGSLTLEVKPKSTRGRAGAQAPAAVGFNGPESA